MVYSTMNKSQITKYYNIDKQIFAKDLPMLVKTYKDNLETILVMMNKKNKDIQPPVWFKEWSETVFIPFAENVDTRLTGLETRMDKLETRMDKLETRMDKLETRMDKLETNQKADHNLLMNVIKLNNLKTA